MKKSLLLGASALLSLSLFGAEQEREEKELPVAKRAKTYSSVEPMDLSGLQYPNLPPFYSSTLKDLIKQINNPQYSPIGHLPPEIITKEILKYLKQKDLTSLAKVNNQMRQYVQGAIQELEFKKTSLDQIESALKAYAGTGIKKIIIDSTDLSKFNWSFLENCTNLEVLEVEACSLTELPSVLKKTTKLKELNLTDNNLSAAQNWDILPRSLERLWLYGCSLTELPSSLGSLQKLKLLDLKYNNLSAAQNWMALPNSLKMIALDQKTRPDGLRQDIILI